MTAKRLLLISALWLCFALPSRSENFDYWWPWIYSRCSAATTNSTNAWYWITVNSGTVYYVASHTNLWDQALTNGYLSASNGWGLAKVGSRFWLMYSTNADTLGGHPWADVQAITNGLSLQWQADDAALSNATWLYVQATSNAYVSADTTLSNSTWSYVQTTSNSLVALDTLLSNSLVALDTVLSNSTWAWIQTTSNAFVSADTVLSNAAWAIFATNNGAAAGPAYVMSNKVWVAVTPGVMVESDPVWVADRPYYATNNGTGLTNTYIMSNGVWTSVTLLDRSVTNGLNLQWQADDTTLSNATWSYVQTTSNSLTVADTVLSNSAWAWIATSSNALVAYDTTLSNSTWLYVQTTSNSLVALDTVLSNSAWAWIAVTSNSLVALDTVLSNSAWAWIAATSNAYVTADTTLSNSTWSYVQTTSNSLVAMDTTLSNSAWAAFATNNGAAGGPAYLMSNKLWTAFTPGITAESDPVWTAAKSLYATNAGTAGGSFYVMSNLLWAAYTPLTQAVTNGLNLLWQADDTTLSNSTWAIIQATSNAYVTADATVSNGVMTHVQVHIDLASNSLTTADTTLSNSLTTLIQATSNAYVTADTAVSNGVMTHTQAHIDLASNSLTTVIQATSNAYVVADTTLSNSAWAIFATNNGAAGGSSYVMSNKLWVAHADPSLAGYATLAGNNEWTGEQSFNRIHLHTQRIDFVCADSSTNFGLQSSLHDVTGQSGSVWLGFLSLYGGSPGTYNAAVGYRAMVNAVGDRNVGIGYSALESFDGADNVGIGNGAVQASSGSTGDRNVGIGMGALFDANGSDNVGIGYQAGQAADGFYGVFLGHRAGTKLLGHSNVVIGTYAQYSATDVCVSNVTILGAGVNHHGAYSVAIGLPQATTYIDGSLRVSNTIYVAGAVTLDSTINGVDPDNWTTNAGTGTTNCYLMSNGVWTAFTPGTGGSGDGTGDVSKVYVDAQDVIVSNACVARDTTLSNSLTTLIQVTSNAYVTADTAVSNGVMTHTQVHIDLASNSLTTVIQTTSNAYVTADTAISNGVMAHTQAHIDVASNSLVTMYGTADTAVSNGIMTHTEAHDTTLSNSLVASSVQKSGDTTTNLTIKTALTIGSATWPMSPANGSMARFDGTNWLATSSYVERPGYPNTWTYTQADLTEDGTWRDMDLSGTIPSGAKAAHILIYAKDASDGLYFQLKRGADTNTTPAVKTTVSTLAANVYNFTSGIIGLDSTRVIKYQVTAGMDEEGIAVCGWWY